MPFETERMAAQEAVSDARRALQRWLVVEHGRVLRSWAALSATISAVLLACALAICTLSLPSGDQVHPIAVTGGGREHFAMLVLRNFTVLLLHLMVCLATYLARRTVVLEAQAKRGVDRWVHEHAAGAAMALVAGATAFSLSLQAWVLGTDLLDASQTVEVDPPALLARLLVHAAPELTAIFLPLAACLMLARRDVNAVGAAALLCTTISMPVIVLAAALEVWVTPLLF